MAFYTESLTMLRDVKRLVSYHDARWHRAYSLGDARDEALYHERLCYTYLSLKQALCDELGLTGIY